METFTPHSRRRSHGEGQTRGSDHSDDSIPSVIFPTCRRFPVSRTQNLRSNFGVCFKEEHNKVLSFYMFISLMLQVMTSIGMVSVGVTLVVKNHRNGLLSDVETNLSLYLLLVSSIIFMISSYLTSLNQNPNPRPRMKLLKSCLTVQVLNVIVLTTAIVWAGKTIFHQRARTYTELQNIFLNCNNSKKAREFFDDLHDKFNCCGIDGKDDWIDISTNVPETCCYQYWTSATCKSWKSDGCFESNYNYLYSFLDYVIGFSSVALSISILAMCPIIVVYICFIKINRSNVRRLKSLENRKNDLQENVPSDVQTDLNKSINLNISDDDQDLTEQVIHQENAPDHQEPSSTRFNNQQ